MGRCNSTADSSSTERVESCSGEDAVLGCPDPQGNDGFFFFFFLSRLVDYAISMYVGSHWQGVDSSTLSLEGEDGKRSLDGKGGFDNSLSYEVLWIPQHPKTT